VGGSGFLIVLLGMFAVMYFLLIRPQKAKQRAAQDMLSRLAPGDEVITIGGIYGDVVEVHDDKVVVEIAEDVHIEVARRAISSIVPPETPETGPGKELEGEYQEPVVVGEPEADGAPDPVREDKRWGVFGRRS
jgi:preprotein translocase subunit YajC